MGQPAHVDEADRDRPAALDQPSARKWHPLPGSALPLSAMIGGLGVLAWRVRGKQPAPLASAENVVTG